MEGVEGLEKKNIHLSAAIWAATKQEPVKVGISTVVEDLKVMKFK